MQTTVREIVMPYDTSIQRNVYIRYRSPHISLPLSSYTASSASRLSENSYKTTFLKKFLVTIKQPINLSYTIQKLLGN